MKSDIERRMHAALKALDANNNLESLEENLDDESNEVMDALENLAEENPAAAAALVKMVEKKKTGSSCPHNRGVLGLKKASVTIKITRTITKGNAVLVDGSAVPVNLPAPIFGVLENGSDYSRVLTAFLPQDGSIKVKSFTKSSNSQGYIITYANADDSINETVAVSGVNTVYTNLIVALNSTEFVINKPKFIISDALRVNQFDQPLNVFIGSPFTSANTDSILPNDYKQEVLGDNTIRVLQDNICVNPEKTLCPMIVPPTITNANGSSFYFSLVMPLSGFKKA